jgi:GDSL-like Lipase/Acylhydrolase family
VALALPVALEGALRWWRPTPCPSAAASEVMACLHTYSEVYGWELRPNIALAIPAGRITIDAHGHRAGATAGAAGRPRVVSLGDSVAFGLDVDDGETLAAQLRLLDPGLDVVDLSVPGYGTDQERIKLEREGLALAPRVVLVHFCLANDLVDNALPVFLYDGVHPKPYFRLEDGALRLHAEHLRLAPAARTALWLAEHSVLFNLLSPGRAGRVLAAQGGDAEKVHWQTRYNEVMARPKPLVDLAARLIESMADLARGGGARVLVVMHPTRHTFADGSPLAADLRARLAAKGVPSIDLAERYQARGLALSDLATDGLGHLNARGHRAAAEAVRDALTELR